MFANDEELSASDISEVCGFSRKSYYRLQRDGVTLERAEKIAHSLGLHPTEIWGSDYLHACSLEDELAGRN
jgi:lambda repressor-like predicted transcriptional regulator